MHYSTLHDTTISCYTTSALADNDSPDMDYVSDWGDRGFWLCQQELHSQSLLMPSSGRTAYYGQYDEGYHRRTGSWNSYVPHEIRELAGRLLRKRDVGYEKYRRAEERKRQFKARIADNLRFGNANRVLPTCRNWNYSSDIVAQHATNGKAVAKELSVPLRMLKSTVKTGDGKPLVTAMEHLWQVYHLSFTSFGADDGLSTSSLRRVITNSLDKFSGAVRVKFGTGVFWSDSTFSADPPKKSRCDNAIPDAPPMYYPAHLASSIGALYYGRFVDAEILDHIKSAGVKLNARQLAFIQSCSIHVSDEDKKLIAYAPSYAYACRNRFIRTSVGKFLTKFFSKRPHDDETPHLTEVQIREIANAYVLKHTPPELRLVPPTDPDGWEWVYENGKSFTSCMTYNRDPGGRYLNENAKGACHPVRAYAHPDSDLHLAWIGIPGKEVWARCMVNPKKKLAVRVYGDDRLNAALSDAGYKFNATQAVIDQPMRIIPLEVNGGSSGYEICLPYFDFSPLGVAKPTADSDHFVIADGNNWDVLQGTSSGVVRYEVRPNRETYPLPLDQQQDKKDRPATASCECCDRDVEEDDLTYIDYEDRSVCSQCLDDNYHYGYVGRYGSRGHIHEEDAIFCTTDQEYYRDAHTSHYNLINIDGDWYQSDDEDIVYLDYIGEYRMRDDCTELYFRKCETDDLYAHDEDVMTDPQGKTFHEDDAMASDLTTENWHESVMWVVELAGSTVTFHPSELADFIERFSVVSTDTDAFLEYSDDTDMEEPYGSNVEFIGPRPQSLVQYLSEHGRIRANTGFDNLTINDNGIPFVAWYLKNILLFTQDSEKQVLAQTIPTSGDERFAIAA